jgi:hypothetical protein
MARDEVRRLRLAYLDKNTAAPAMPISIASDHADEIG